LLHEARIQGLQHEMEERLFEAHFVEGKNIDDVNILQELASEIGLDTTALDVKILSGQYSNEIQADLDLAQTEPLSLVQVFPTQALRQSISQVVLQ
jgi:predicted DsbA family dithiol-disulfide isomerase